MEAAATVRRWGYAGCCCAALLLPACPQLLGDDFLVGRELEQPAAGPGAGTGGQGGGAGAGQGGGAGPSAGTGGASNAPSCSDGERNQDETGVDCGGVCATCCAFGPFHDVVQVEGLGSDDRFGPALSADGKTLYFSVETTNSGEDLYRAQRSGTGTVFTDMEAVPNLNGSTLEGSPFLSSDDRTLLFFSDRAGGVGNRDLWMATRASASEEFSGVQLLANVNSADMDLLPRLSPDGLTLLFESTRGGGADIWAAERATPEGDFGIPYLRTDLNSSSRDEGLSLTRDQRTVVIASGRGGDMALWIATRPIASADFGAATILGELDSEDDELDPALSADGREIFFVTTRDGDYRIYHALRDCL